MTTAVHERFEVAKVEAIEVYARTVEATVRVLDLEGDEEREGVYRASVHYDREDGVYRVLALGETCPEHEAVEAWARASRQLAEELSARFERHWDSYYGED